MTSKFSTKPILGIFEQQSDVGRPSRTGSCAYDPQRQAYVVEGSGANVWGEHDDFHYVWKQIKGDFTVTAQARFIGDGVNAHRKLGWMVRSGLDGAAANVNTGIHGDGLTSLQFRRTPGGATEEIRFSITAPELIQLERRGNSYIMSAARHGEVLATEQLDGIDLGDQIYVGLYVCSHNDAVSERAIFEDVRLAVP